MSRLGPEIGDETEGLKSFHGPLASGILAFVYGSSINAWCLSCCKVQDRRFYKEFDADCCIEISSPQYFVELGQAAVSQAWLGGLYNILYGNVEEAMLRHRKGDEAIIYMLWKRERYRWQQEVRFSLEPWSPSPPRETAMDPFAKEDLQEQFLTSGPHATAYSRVRNFPHLQPLMLYAPAAIPFAKIVERRPV